MSSVSRAYECGLADHPVYETESFKVGAYKIASYLTDPICKAHELYRRIYTVDVLNPTASKIANFARKCFLALGALFVGILGLITAPFGAAIRFIGSHSEKRPFIHLLGEAPSSLVKEEFYLFTWNVCCVGGGYPISDGGVMPWSDRISDIIKTIRDANDEVICLQELFDAKASFTLLENLKDRYSHFYLNIGPRAVGPSSGLFVASKFEIKNPHFVPFSKDALHENAVYSEKGVFYFDLCDQSQTSARIYTTHFQHSEECEHPTNDEMACRRKAMKQILKIDKARDKSLPAIVTGDINADEKEYKASDWDKYFIKETDFKGKFTWGGDLYSATHIRGKRPSSAMTLDYALLLKGSNATITTTLLDTGYDGAKFNKKATSDHTPLRTKVSLNRKGA